LDERQAESTVDSSAETMVLMLVETSVDVSVLYSVEKRVVKLAV